MMYDVGRAMSYGHDRRVNDLGSLKQRWLLGCWRAQGMDLRNGRCWVTETEGTRSDEAQAGVSDVYDGRVEMIS